MHKIFKKIKIKKEIKNCIILRLFLIRNHYHISPLETECIIGYDGGEGKVFC